MKSEWKKVKLGDISLLIQPGPFGTQLHNSDYTDTGVPVIMPKDMMDGRINHEKLEHTSEEKAKSLSRHRVKEGDIIVARKGDVRKCIHVKKAEEGWVVGSDCLRVSLKEELCNPLFVYYHLKSPITGASMMQISKGATMPSLNTSLLAGINLVLPSIEIQHRIATILSRYDSLIENCRKQIKLLEEAAQRLYREWFIDLRFPGHENTAIIDGVPEGWEMKKISDVCELSAGKDKPSIVENTITETCKVPVYSNGITDEGLFGYTDVPRIVCESVTISARGTIGYACLRMHPYVPIVRLLVLIPKAFVSAKFIYQWTLCKEFKGNGAAQQQLTVPLFRDEEILLPTKSLMKSFGEKEDIIFESIDNIKSHLRLLTEARDRLLPKLMSGEIDV